jgi:Iap family predicted aminopeptidase
MTPQGYKLIKLRPYQKRVLTEMVENKFICFLASRQIGKCCLGSTYIQTSEGNKSFHSIYYDKIKKIRKLTLFERIKCTLYDMYKIKPARDINKANLVIFNTCGVRQTAEDRVYGQIHNLRKNNPKIKIILTGCLANRKDVQRRLKNKVDLFCEIKDFPEKLKTLLIRHPERGDSRVEGSTPDYF